MLSDSHIFLYPHHLEFWKNASKVFSSLKHHDLSEVVAHNSMGSSHKEADTNSTITTNSEIIDMALAAAQ